MNGLRTSFLAALILVIGACASSRERSVPEAPTFNRGAVEATSLLGQPLYRPVPADAARERFEAALDSNLQKLRENRRDAEARIWVGRHLAYLGRYNDAIETFSRGVADHPSDARFLRHRGHRYITVRRFDQAIADLQRAARLVEEKPDEVEPDGIPNARGIPTSTLQFNIWYHLGLAHYLRNDLPAALAAYERCLDVSTNPDALVATVHWMYMTLRRLDRDADARRLLDRVQPGVEIIENESYHDLVRMYRGELPVDSLWSSAEAGSVEDVTVAYGVANWHLYNGQRATGERMLREIVSRGQWPAFAHIAAEADLARLERRAANP